MEDRHCIVRDMREVSKKDLPAEEQWSLFGVYDGHGGDVCSTLVAGRLHTFVGQHDAFPSDIPQAMEGGLRQIDRAFQEEHSTLMDDGSTVVFAIMRSEQGVPRNLWVANCGDSRAILVKYDGSEYVSKALSEDHKPSRPDELARIQEAGGQVKETSFFGIQGPCRVYDAQNRGGLAISRGVGDLLLKQGDLVIAKPDFVEYQVKESTVGIVLASDGLWDVFSNDEVASLVGQMMVEGIGAQEVATRLVRKACQHNQSSYMDNITVLFVCISNPANGRFTLTREAAN